MKLGLQLGYWQKGPTPRFIELAQVAESLGFEKARQSGSHVIPRPGSSGCAIALHSEVKVGTLAGACAKPTYRLKHSFRSYNRGAQPGGAGDLGKDPPRMGTQADRSAAQPSLKTRLLLGLLCGGIGMFIILSYFGVIPDSSVGRCRAIFFRHRPS